MLRYTAGVCPMQCPKQLRNGPCGGSMNGGCEVYPDHPCVWYVIYQRSRQLHREAQLDRILPGVDWSLAGTSSWLNHLAGRDPHLFGREPAELPLQPVPNVEIGPSERRAA